MNYLRTFIVDIARTLADKGLASWLPDLPGTGESLCSLAEVTWEDWRGAIRTAGETIERQTGRKPHVASFRGGALLAGAVDALSWWSHAPASGASLLRHLQRAQLISDHENDRQPADSKSEILHCAGYELSRAMRDALASAVEPTGAGPSRTVPAPEGTPLWRRAEPGRDRELSAALADDIADWIASCENR